ncbi:hypothetical protein KORDIASMS9_00089 [Kordia sp. SMS9]|uniref:hypothetical protein n=1 Tax=Kordia sp. SMS9 TaxID=2282170 RepID=UPI000E0DA100|nr:hypothetical protein [Kordia sp. SMS9]AXG67907.1 hypothetical protein KORDIASMS9_00089 [Kordia sp. SMS9]
MKTQSTLTVLLLLLLFSCSPEENTSDKIIQGNNVKTLYDFDNYGISHNLAMDHIATMPNFNTASLEDIFYFADTYTDAYLDNSCQCNDWQTHETQMDMIEQLQENMNSASSILVNMNVITPQEVPLTDMLFTIFDNAVSLQNNSYKSIQEFTAEIEALENFVFNNYTIIYDPVAKTGNYAATILGACSIAKNSYSYWVTATLNSAHSWNYRLTQLNPATRNGNTISPIQKGIFGDIWRGIKRAGADVGGFIVGGDCGGILDGRDLGCAIKHAKKKSSGVRR